MTIATPRLTLRRFAGSDLSAVAALLADPEVMRFSDAGPLSAAQAKAWLAARCVDGGILGTWAVAAKGEAALGYVSLTQNRLRTGPGEVELGIRLRRAAWGQGLAAEAAGAVCARAAQAPDLKRVLAIVDPGNAPSVRLVTRLGFHQAGEFWGPDYDHADHVYAKDLVRP